MKSLGVWLLVGAALVLGWIAVRSPEPDYVVPQDEQFEPQVIPIALTSAAADGDVVRTFDVSGMCCNGCTSKLFEALDRHPSVNAAAVSFRDGTAQASVPRDLDPQLLERELTFDKYTAALRAD